MKTRKPEKVLVPVLVDTIRLDNGELVEVFALRSADPDEFVVPAKDSDGELPELPF